MNETQERTIKTLRKENERMLVSLRQIYEELFGTDEPNWMWVRAEFEMLMQFDDESGGAGW
jgi:hypothetical protein